MAGAGWRDFIAGEVLTAANVQDYLQDQAVMTFASSAARGSAIASPTEGMVSFLKDSNLIEAHDGSAWKQIGATTGGILQVASVIVTTDFTTASTTYVDATGYSLAFTPKASTSKIVIFATLQRSVNKLENSLVQLLRGSTAIFEPQESVSGGSGWGQTAMFAFVEDASSTSARTYKIQVRTVSGTMTVANGSIIIMEVAA